MTDHNCNQVEKIISMWKDIEALQTNHKDVMDVINEIRGDVKELKKYIFEWGMDSKYASKSSVNRLWTIVWGVVWFCAAYFGTVLFAKLFKW